MNNEFGYIYPKPFKECDKDEQVFSTISIDDDGIEIKANDAMMFSVFSEEFTDGDVYAVDSKLNAITAINARVTKSTWSAISHSMINAKWYFIKQGGLSDNNKITHFTRNTKIRELRYYNESLNRVFFNEAIQFKYNIKKSSLNALEIKAHSKKDELIGKFGNVSIYFNKGFSFNSPQQGKRTITIADQSHLVLKFKIGIDYEYAYKYILVLDTVLYLMTLLSRRHSDIYIYDYKKNKYYSHDRLTDNSNNKPKNKRFLICNNSETKEHFLKLFENIYKIEVDSRNAIFPIMNFDSQNKSLEIRILEYYKALEYIKKKEMEAQGNPKNTKFLKEILSNDVSLKEKFFGQQDPSEIEEEIRSLRNYYSHDGFYVEDLPIPTEKPRRYKKIDYEWIFNVYSFLRLVTYMEIYKSCGIVPNWSNLKSYL